MKTPGYFSCVLFFCFPGYCFVHGDVAYFKYRILQILPSESKKTRIPLSEPGVPSHLKAISSPCNLAMIEIFAVFYRLTVFREHLFLPFSQLRLIFTISGQKRDVRRMEPQELKKVCGGNVLWKMKKMEILSFCQRISKKRS